MVKSLYLLKSKLINIYVQNHQIPWKIHVIASGSITAPLANLSLCVDGQMVKPY